MMDTPLYKLFFHNTVISPWQGAQRLLLCHSRWSNAQQSYFGIDMYPSIATLLEAEQAAGECDCPSESFLGLPLDGTANNLTPPPPPPPEELSIYRVYLSRLTADGLRMNPAELEDTWARARERLHQVGALMILSGYTRWNNEEWDTFGVERFHSLESLIEYSQLMSTSNWYRVTTARSYLGVAIGGNITGLDG